MSSLPRFAALAFAALAFSFGARASAYCLTRTCDPNSGACERAPNSECIISGLPLFWPNSCVSYDIQKDGSPLRHIDYDAVSVVARNAFNRWLQADCGNGKHPGLAQIVDLGAVDCKKPEYNKDQPNANVVTFHDDTWEYTNTADTVALTTVFFNGDTGEIYDANVEVNSNQYPVAVNPMAGELDLNAVLTHEFGHFLGLSHSDVTNATMYKSYDAGMVTLEQDDETGICLALPPGRDVASDSCTPRHGFSGECGKPESGCCATAVGRSASDGETLGLAVFALGLCVWGGRARFKPRAKRSALPR